MSISTGAQTLSSALAQLDDNADGVSMYFTSYLLATRPELIERWPVGLAAQRRTAYDELRGVVAACERGDDVSARLSAWARGLSRMSIGPDELEGMVYSVEATLRRFLGDAFIVAHSAQLAAVHQAMMPMLTGPMSDSGAQPARIEAEVVGHQRRGGDLAVVTVHPATAIPYVPGQSLPLALGTRPKVWRPFTPAHAPRSDGTIELHVRAVAGGYVSPSLVYDTVLGDVVALAPAVGTMGWSGDRPRAVLVASGTGVTPFAAMLDQRARSKGGTKRGAKGGAVTLVLCGRRQSGVYDLESVRRIEAAADWLGVETLAGTDALSRLAADERWADARWGAGAEVRVCGSPCFVTDVVEALGAAGHDTRAIQREQYASEGSAPIGATAHGGGTA